MDKLLKAREIINKTDKEIACLFEKRMEAVRLVAEYKAERGLPAFDAERENFVIENNLRYINDENIRGDYLHFLKETMNISKRFQNSLINKDKTGIITVNLGENSYEIVLQRGSLKRVGELLDISKDRKVLVVTDSGVPEEYAKTVASFWRGASVFTVPQGEANKNFEVYKSICQKLLELSFTRTDCVIAVGGGVVGDLAGFAASTYMRGIDFYNIPTTLLSQVDSSVGGKTGIDFGEYKNIIGAFYQPKKVIIDPDVLKTLPERQLKNGLAESIKMGLTSDKDLFRIFKNQDYFSYIDEIIERSVKVKRYVVERDEKESGLRKVLNFGHTVGHAVESVQKELLHGECVAIGMTYMCNETVRDELLEVLRNVGLLTEYKFDKEKIFEALCHDKKSDGEEITVVKCENVGSFIFEKMLPTEIVKLI